MDTPRKCDRVGTCIGRVFSGCIGGVLLFSFIALKMWRDSNTHFLFLFAGITGLCFGYAFGGDIWGARLYDLFTGHSSAQHAEKPLHPVMQKTMLVALIGLLAFVLLVWIAVLVCMRFAKQ